ncbi:hypothetical protein A6A08_24390 [Nocardiopsis sp. TSRI0078]|nr:hypothetical protein A6A08_24390 [Nocardiopsis sp. TSRI0078]
MRSMLEAAGRDPDAVSRSLPDSFRIEISNFHPVRGGPLSEAAALEGHSLLSAPGRPSPAGTGPASTAPMP